MTVKRVSVAVGERNDGRVEIVSGLQEGDRVVTSGQPAERRHGGRAGGAGYVERRPCRFLRRDR